MEGITITAGILAMAATMATAGGGGGTTSVVGGEAMTEVIGEGIGGSGTEVIVRVGVEEGVDSIEATICRLLAPAGRRVGVVSVEVAASVVAADFMGVVDSMAAVDSMVAVAGGER